MLPIALDAIVPVCGITPECLQWCRSAAIRDEFRLLRRNSMALQQRVDVDTFISFLTAMARLNPNPPAPRAFVPYKQVKI
ncbi:MAG: hypothetical protein HYY81_13115 [Deltaproteobacteria bacterium]|nr:hypothetical protein [Deltaproteobacteria bacterium]